MKTYELLPTNENLLNTFIQDSIGRNADIFSFIEMLNKLENGCAIALEGRWGSGKTFFVKQVKLLMDTYNDSVISIDNDTKEKIKAIAGEKISKIEIQPQVCVYYDAWENDNDDDPILSMVYSIVQDGNEAFDFSLNSDCIKKAAAVLELITGRNWPGIIKNFNSTDPLAGIKSAKKLDEAVGEFMESLLFERGNRLIIFIDELDRCKPSYAVKLLERIKHYFNNDRITFVFSINSLELQHTIKKFYGNDFDACRYLDRFFDWRISLPPEKRENFYQNMNFAYSRWTYDIVCKAVIDQYHFSLREICKYIASAKAAAGKAVYNDRQHFDFSFPDGRARQFCLLYVVPIMIGLKLYNTQQYDAFIDGLDSSPMVAFENCLNQSFFEWLLNNKETYDPSDSDDKDTVSIQSKLEAVYKAIFATDFSIRQYAVEIGQLLFGRDTKELLLQIVNYASNYRDLDIK